MGGGGLLLPLTAALVAALVGGTLATLSRQSLLVGYLLAGLAVGPYTSGLLRDVATISALADVGIVFLMFTVGARMSLPSLLAIGRSGIVASLAQVSTVMALGYAVGRAVGLGSIDALFLGAVVSNSSSTVFGKMLAERGEHDTSHARSGLAWSSFQDLTASALIVLLPLVAPERETSGGGMVWGAEKALLFLGGVVPLSFVVIPRLLRRLEHLHSRELFVVAVVAVALSMATIANALGTSVALGAFLAGIVVGESDISHHVLGSTVPLRDAFAGLFFVSVGMLIDPAFVWRNVGLVVMGVSLIVVVKGAVTVSFARIARMPRRIAVLIGLGLAQSGEFSFLIANIGWRLRLISDRAFNLMLSASVLSILLAPLLYRLPPLLLRLSPRRRTAPPSTPEDEAVEFISTGHAIVCGYGRVGEVVADVLARAEVPYVIIEEDLHRAYHARRQGRDVVMGDASDLRVLTSARLAHARVVIACIPERMGVRRIVDFANATRPGVKIIARTHSVDERRRLRALGASDPVLGELELALEMGRRALTGWAVELSQVEEAIAEVRQNRSPS